MTANINSVIISFHNKFHSYVGVFLIFLAPEWCELTVSVFQCRYIFQWSTEHRCTTLHFTAVFINYNHTIKY